jgi:integrase
MKKEMKRAAEVLTANTFKMLADELIAKKISENRTEKTIEKLKWLLSLAIPELGHRAINSISAPDVLTVLRRVEARGRLETAGRLRGIIGEIFRYAIATGRAESDPTGALKGALITPTTKHRAAIVDPLPFGGLLPTIDSYNGSSEVVCALQLLTLTFVRPGELRHSEWSEFHLEARIWSIPAAKMKMRRAHRVPLTEQALAILTRLKPITGDGRYLFPSTRSRDRCMSENTLNAALRRMGYGKDEMTSHGFRASASSMLNESGKWNPDAIEAQLAHVDQNAIRRAYDRAEFWDERVKMMTWWADRLDDLRAH